MKQYNIPEILVIDDDINVLGIVRAILERLGCYVETASGGREGIRKFDTRHFDIVITDINMPDLDGNDVADYVRNSGKQVHIIAISGSPWSIEQERRFDAFLPKPFLVNQLRHAVFNGAASA
jgi:two-component system capsular synthesis sensor histidine kinase RcsC